MWGLDNPASKRCKAQTTNLIHVQKYFFVCYIMIVGQSEVSLLPKTAISAEMETQIEHKTEAQYSRPTASTKVNKYEDKRSERGQIRP